MFSAPDGCAGGKGLRTPEIDHQGAVFDQCRGIGCRDCGRRWNTIRQAANDRAVAIDFLHPREVRRRLRQIGEDGIHECRLRGLLQERVEAPFLPDGRMWRMADAGAAKRAGAMPRVDFDGIVEGHQSIEQRVVQVTGQPARLIGAKQIGATDGSDEQRVAGEDASGSIGFAHEQRNVLGRVARRMQHVDCDVPDAQRLAVRRFVKREPERSARTGDDLRAKGRKLAGAGDEIGVDVRFDRVGERQPMSRRYRGVRVDVAPGVDDRSRACPLAGDQERALRKAFVGKPFKHEVRSAFGS